MQNYRPTNFQIMPPGVKNLMIINGLVFLFSLLLQSKYNTSLNQLGGLYPIKSPNFHYYQVFTHFFLHGSTSHIFSNMFTLWMFGTMLENVWGTKRFLIYYVFTALGASVLHQLVNYAELYQFQQKIMAFVYNPSSETFENVDINTSHLTEKGLEIYNGLRGQLASGFTDPQIVESGRALFMQFYDMQLNIPTIGASGAVFGLLMASLMYFPNTIMFPLPIKLKYYVIAIGCFEVYRGIVNNPGDNIAHFAHIGGMLFGYLLIKYWNRNLRNKFY